MKDHRFIELVNLYVDRQITAAETAELEAEIQSSPRRRAIYRQYCQMHHATTLVFDSFRAEAPGQPAAETGTQGAIAQFENRQRVRRHRWTYLAGGLAAAACVAFVLVQSTSKPAPGGNPVPVSDGQPTALVAAAHPALPPRATVAQPVNVVIGPASLRNVAEPDYVALLTALRQEEQRNRQMASGRTPSLFEDGVFDVQQALPTAGQRTFRSQQTPAQQAEFTAFQFQR